MHIKTKNCDQTVKFKVKNTYFTMDILDIDEVLQDDSFIFLGEKTHDDVSNILQQWKHSTSPSYNQGYKLNSRTFTRPKKKAPENSENAFGDCFYKNETSQKLFDNHNFQMEIGGLVTTQEKSFLQDTSPPPSICSSIGLVSDQINSSLIISEDFPKSIECKNSFDINNVSLASAKTDYLNTTMQCSKKSLNSPTFSNESTYNKDLQIAQIDDISLALYKTESGCSTMNSSTESFDLHNQNDEFFMPKNIYNDFNVKTSVLDDASLKMDTILDKTFNLKEIGTASNDDTKSINYSSVLKSELLSNLSSKEIQELQNKTPENSKIMSEKGEFSESTPKIYSKYLYKPSLNLNTVNVSPIDNFESGKINNLNKTFDQEPSSISKLQKNICLDFDDKLKLKKKIEISGNNKTLLQKINTLTEDNQILKFQNINENNTDQKLQKLNNISESKNENQLNYDLKTFKPDNSVGRLLNRRNRLYDGIDINSLNKHENINPNCIDSSENLEESDIKCNNSNTNYKYTEKRERNRDRFKTIRIDKKCDEYNLNVPSSNCNENTIDSTEEIVSNMQLLQNCDKPTEIDRLPEKSLIAKSFIIEKHPNECIFSSNEIKNPIQIQTKNLLLMEEKRLQFRSLSQPRQYKGVKKLDNISKARSTTNLQKIHETSHSDNKNGRLKNLNNVESHFKNSYNYENSKNCKSKSVHNLSNNTGQNPKLSIKQINNGKMLEKQNIHSDRISIYKKRTDETTFEDSKFSSETVIPAKHEKIPSTFTRPQLGYCNYNNKEKTSTLSNDNNCQRKQLIYPKKMHLNTLDDNKVNQTQSLKETNQYLQCSKSKNVTGSLKPSASSKPSGLPRPKSIIKR